MFTGITSWTMGSTKAPPLSTTFWPPMPVRTNARSLDERRYSQCSSQTAIATTIATTIEPENEGSEFSAGHDVLLLPLAGYALNFSGLLGERHLGGQALHAGGAVEAVALRAMLRM